MTGQSTQDVIRQASAYLQGMQGHIFDLLTVSQPVNHNAAVNLSKVVSKLSPLLGNLIEFNVVEYLNKKTDFPKPGKWIRQDPGFPDAIFDGVTPNAGFEIKAWFPLATEITARFKDSQLAFVDDNTYVCFIAWLPEFIIYGRPYILDVTVISGRSIAQSRDNHYHNPPDYIVLEPQDTSLRTQNLRQTNTNGFKWQSVDVTKRKEAEAFVRSWGPYGHIYDPSPAYQEKLRELTERYTYRGDTNYAKTDRIENLELEAFKTRVHKHMVHGLSVSAWERLFRSGDERKIADTLDRHLNFKTTDPDLLLE